MDCDICAFTEENENTLLTTPHWIVNLAPKQSFLGRSYVTLVQHQTSLSELSTDEWLDFASVVKQLESSARKAFGATMFNWTCLMNDAYKEPVPHPHVHWHFRPRYSQPITINGVTFEDPDFGLHYRTAWDGFQEKLVDSEMLAVIAKKLKEVIGN